MTSITIIRYRNRFIPLALLAMALFRISLFRLKGIRFWKLLGTGRNGGFEVWPDWRQWVILTIRDESLLSFPVSEFNDQPAMLKNLYGSFISRWIRLFARESWTLFLETISGHGTWDGKAVFGSGRSGSEPGGRIAVITRATIRTRHIRSFRKKADPVTVSLKNNVKGLIFSMGIGEVPLLRQATLSIWESTEDMQAYAYGQPDHISAMKAAREGNWFGEELFIRFRVTGHLGNLYDIDPLAGIP